MRSGERHATAVGGASSPAAETTMRAIVQDGYGPADVLRLARITRPEIGDHDVLLRVHAAGLDRGAWHLMRGQPDLLRLGFGIRRPRNPVAGREVAGTVVAAGPAVTSFRAGDEVFGTGRGSFAEYTAARADRLARKPANATFEERSSDLERLADLIEAGTVTPSIGRTYPLDQVPEAMRHLEAGAGPGKDRHHHLSHDVPCRGSPVTGPHRGWAVLLAWCGRMARCGIRCMPP